MSRLHANYYSCGKYRFATPAPTDESFLYSDGRYKTKMTAHDMPPWYMCGRYYGYAQGFLNTKDVAKLIYSPNFHFNHMFKDDFLYISYNSPSKRRKIFNAEEPYDEYVWGLTFQNSCTWQSGTAAMIPPPSGSRSKKSASGSNAHTRMTTNARSVI